MTCHRFLLPVDSQYFPTGGTIYVDHALASQSQETPPRSTEIEQPGTARHAAAAFRGIGSRALLDVGCGLLPGPDAGEPIDAGATPSWTIVPGEVLVGLRTDGRVADVGAYAETIAWPGALGPVGSSNVEELFTVPKSKGQFLTMAKIHLTAAIDVPDAVAELDRLGVVEFAEPNWFIPGGSAEAEPNDPYYESAEGQYFHDVIETPGAWQWFQDQRDPPEWGGEGITVAVIDSGVDSNHPDLDDNVWPGGFEPVYYHGTHVAGIVAAETDNGLGVAGVAGDARIMALAP